MKRTISVELSTDSLKRMQESLQKFSKALNKGSAKAIEEITIAFYEAVKKNCYDKGIVNHTNNINWEFDNGNKTGKVYTNDAVIVFNEIGTGIVGSNNPHPSLNWKYDINEHGEKGWKYPKEDGTYGWTKGLPSKHMFHDAFEEIKLQVGEKINIEIINFDKELY